MSDSEKEVFLKLRHSFGNSFGPSTATDFSLCQSSNQSHCKPGCSQVDVGDLMSNLFKSDAAGDANF